MAAVAFLLLLPVVLYLMERVLECEVRCHNEC